ncbi:MAG: ATP/GTP-binding protein, partial [Thermoplasmata archaeon]|nr:ATP/GTP-binding protein [Thermoplasmata archaeon]
DYVLVDTPGQIELFGFRSSSQAMMRTLSPERAMIAYMFDPNLVRTPAGFISSLMLWATVSSRFLIPSLGILAKADLVEQKHLDKIAAWTDDLSVLYADATEEEQSMHTILNVEFLKAMEDLGILSKVIPTSALNFFGMEDLYNGIQQTFAGGEDIGEK